MRIVIALGLVVAVAALGLALYTGNGPAVAQEEVLRPVFINLTSGANDPQKASMALVLAEASLDSGREVTLYLNVHGVKLADATGELAMFKRETLFRDYITELAELGMVVLACPYCMERNELTEEDLLPGISTASGDNFFASIDAGAAVFSY